MFLEGKAVSVEPTRRVVRLEDGQEVGYDEQSLCAPLCSSSRAGRAERWRVRSSGARIS